MNIIEELKQRGIFKQISNYQKFLNLPSNSGVYVGFDPTAESLHLGNYIQIVNLIRFQKYGFKTYAILGGATGMIGDPSFKENERQLLDEKTILINKNKIKKQLEKFNLTVIDNFDFYQNMTVIDFLRHVGKLVNISTMLSKDSVSARIEKGLSFTEFAYQLIQGWDFATLYKNYNVCIQYGGSDQWGNIITGLDMIAQIHGSNHNAIALTANLLTDSNGVKFGKSTGGGNNWIDSEKTKPYLLYQFLVTQPDSEVEKLLKWLTFLTIEEIDKLIKNHFQNSKLKLAQKKLAFEVIKDIHSYNEAKKSEIISDLLFNKDIDFKRISIEDVKSIKYDLPLIKVKMQSNLVEKLINFKLIQSKREAREFIANKSLKINGIPIEENFLMQSNLYENKFAFLNIGKKKFYLIEIN
ncbi:tyrosine--tRNA ligase [Mycoplasmopsis cricetuli]|uniref:tyrosine--tRNA ligase n=1 Tax=Mycoplasmopsis cricetuli TaxID=171283 RepID=UPI000472CA85|nr:tyrosine--tRNA ligase [Mycoplasmopsis cricetuli]